MKKLLTTFDIAERIYNDRLSTFATSKIDLDLCDIYISDLKMFGELVDPSCTPESVLSLLKSAVATNGGIFYG